MTPEEGEYSLSDRGGNRVQNGTPGRVSRLMRPKG